MQTEAERNQVEEQKRIDELPIDYTVNHIPVNSSSLFIEAFAYDISLIFASMETKKPTKKLTTNLDIQVSASVSPSKIPIEPTTKKKKKEKKSEMQIMIDQFMDHFKAKQ